MRTPIRSHVNQAVRPPCAAPCAGLCREDGMAVAYRDHRSMLVGRARTMLGDAGLAEDVVQEVFLRAWSACASFDPACGPPLVSWLLTITRNVVIDTARARAVRPRLLRTAPADEADRAVASSATDTATLRSVLLDALARVSEEHRDIVLKTVVHDRSYADVAAELDVPVGTVKSRVHYALRGMRGLLDRYELAS